ncbi:hypothetical protein OH779_07305 [Actinacidiphila glaucinigra]|uniref:hypothetical protein n=1 Tax=Actinacidiphila glaucinigra TaxID=235986 RepID=UPI003867E0D5
MLITLVSASCVTWLLSSLLSDHHRLPAAHRFRAVGITVAIGLPAFLLRKFNHLFLTCADFSDSGNNTPRDCAPGPPSRLR